MNDLELSAPWNKLKSVLETARKECKNKTPDKVTHRPSVYTRTSPPKIASGAQGICQMKIPYMSGVVEPYTNLKYMNISNSASSTETYIHSFPDAQEKTGQILRVGKSTSQHQSRSMKKCSDGSLAHWATTTPRKWQIL